MKLVSASWVLVGCLSGSLLVGCGGGGDDSSGGGDGDGATTGDGDGDSDGTCERDRDCDDGLVCNGEETCVDGMCEDGEPIECDGAGCESECDEDAGGCVAADEDRDGFGDARCGGDDCDDDNSNRYPGNTEVCDDDGVDEDCDPNTFGEKDSDGDGSVDEACFNTDEDGEVNRGGDCDDENLAVRAGIPEFCDNQDNDCDGDVDEDVGAVTWYADHDGDGFGGIDAPTKESCVQPFKHSLYATDCDDDDIQVHPAQLEVCDDGINNDCDDRIDEGPMCSNPDGEPVEDESDLPDYMIPDCTMDEHCDDFIDCTTDSCEAGVCVNEPPDEDNDGHYDETCLDLDGMSLGDDCDDDEPDNYAGNEERCDSIDNDCNGGVDDIAMGTCCVSDGECDDSDPYTLGDICEWTSPDAGLDGCVPGVALELDCRGIDTTFYVTDDQGVPVREYVMLEDQMWFRDASDSWGNSWPSTWTAQRNQDEWQSIGPRPQSGEFFAMDFFYRSQDSRFVRLGFADGERYTMVSNNSVGSSWPAEWTAVEGLSDVWGGTNNAPPSGGIDAVWTAPVRTGIGALLGYQRRYFAGSNTHTTNGDNQAAGFGGSYQQETLSSFFGSTGVVPPTDGIDAALRRDILDGTGTQTGVEEVIYRGTGRFSRVSTDAYGVTWDEPWTVENIDDYWGSDTNAPPTICTPWVAATPCPPDPNAGTMDSPLSGGDSTCYSGAGPSMYLSFDDDSIGGSPYRYRYRHWYGQGGQDYFFQLAQINGANGDSYETHGYTTGQAGQVNEAIRVTSGNPYLLAVPVNSDGTAMCSYGTISFWMNLSAYPSAGTASIFRTPRMIGPSPTQPLVDIGITSLSTLRVNARTADSVIEPLTSVPLDEWVHVAVVTGMVFPPIGPGTMTVQLYLNGEFIDSSPMSVGESCAIWDASAHVTRIAEGVDGMLDEVAYIREGLSHEDVYRLYLMGLDGRQLLDSNLLFDAP